jgi:predicted dehydrogenase
MGERAELVAAVDVDAARVQAICTEHNIPHAYTTAAEMLTAEQPDLVHIVTPNSTHKELVVQCLEAGAWVFCEKPLCISLSEFDEIDQAEKRTGRYASTVFQWRTGSAAKHLKRLIGERVLGRLLVGVCNTLWYRADKYYAGWHGKWASEGGGAAITLGIHLMDLLLWLFGEDQWQEVRAMIGTLDHAIEAEDVSMALVRFESGALGTIIQSSVSPRQESRLRLDFQHATVEVNTLYRYSNENWRFTPRDGLTDRTVLASWEALTEDIPSAHHVQYGEVLDSMARGGRPPANGEESRRVLEFIASLYKAALTCEPVRRGSITPGDPFYHAMNGKQVEKL